MALLIVIAAGKFVFFCGPTGKYIKSTTPSFYRMYLQII